MGFEIALRKLLEDVQTSVISEHQREVAALQARIQVLSGQGAHSSDFYFSDALMRCDTVPAERSRQDDERSRKLENFEGEPQHVNSPSGADGETFATQSVIAGLAIDLSDVAPELLLHAASSSQPVAGLIAPAEREIERGVSQLDWQKPRLLEVYQMKTEAPFAAFVQEDGDNNDEQSDEGDDEIDDDDHAISGISVGDLDLDIKIKSTVKVEEVLTPGFCTKYLIVSPNSPKRLTYDVLGVFILLIDLILIPFTAAFSPAPSVLLEVLGWLTLTFWTFDIPASFCVGFANSQGVVISDPRKIALRYLKSWFGLDFLIVAVDWVIIVFTFMRDQEAKNNAEEEQAENAGLARAGKMLRTMRILRTLRLLRLAKLRQILNKIQDYVDSEYMTLVLDIVKALLFIVFINHFIACIWYMIGINPAAGEDGWVAKFEALKQIGRPTGYFYGTSLHWSLTQFTPASMDLQPTNSQERYFAIVVLLLAMLVFSSFVASLTGAVTALRGLSGKHHAQLWLLRKYLRQRGVSTDLAVRINRYVDVVVQEHMKLVQKDEVKLLSMLSGPLYNELQTELVKPLLVVHPFFLDMETRSGTMLRKLCNAATQHSSLSRGDIMFSGGEEARFMYFIVRGILMYDHKDLRNKNKSERLQCAMSGQWICESVLWTHWIHQGRCRARNECELVQLSSKKFQDVCLEHPSFLSFVRAYGQMFIDEFHSTCIQNNGLLTDLQVSIAESTATTEFLQTSRSSFRIKPMKKQTKTRNTLLGKLVN